MRNRPSNQTTEIAIRPRLNRPAREENPNIQCWTSDSMSFYPFQLREIIREFAAFVAQRGVVSEADTRVKMIDKSSRTSVAYLLDNSIGFSARGSESKDA